MSRDSSSKTSPQTDGYVVLIGVGFLVWLFVFGAYAPEMVRAWNNLIGVGNSDAAFIAGFIALSGTPIYVIAYLQALRGVANAE